MALLTPSSVVLATDLDGLVFSARNRLAGIIISADKGAVNSEVVLETGNKLQISAVVTNASFDNAGLAVGVKAMAIFKTLASLLLPGN